MFLTGFVNFRQIYFRHFVSFRQIRRLVQGGGALKMQCVRTADCGIRGGLFPEHAPGLQDIYRQGRESADCDWDK